MESYYCVLVVVLNSAPLRSSAMIVKQKTVKRKQLIEKWPYIIYGHFTVITTNNWYLAAIKLNKSLSIIEFLNDN